MNHRIVLFAGAAALAAAVASPFSQAATASRQESVTAAGVCVPFSPTGQIRYAASSVRNGGTSTFYLACALQAGAGLEGTSNIMLYAYNSGTEAITVNCTLRPGTGGSTGTTTGSAYPQSLNLAPASAAFMSWDAETLIGPGERFAAPNFTCTMPAGASINFFTRSFVEDVGA